MYNLGGPGLDISYIVCRMNSFSMSLDRTEVTDRPLIKQFLELEWLSSISTEPPWRTTAINWRDELSVAIRKVQQCAKTMMGYSILNTLCWVKKSVYLSRVNFGVGGKYFGSVEMHDLVYLALHQPDTLHKLFDLPNVESASTISCCLA